MKINYIAPLATLLGLVLPSVKLARREFIQRLAALLGLVLPSAPLAGGEVMNQERQKLSNQSYRLTMTCPEGGEGTVSATLDDLLLGLRVADGTYLYRAECQSDQGTQIYHDLGHPSLSVNGHTLTIRGVLAGLSIEHTLFLPADKALMEERIVVRNQTKSTIALSDFEAGFQRRVAGRVGEIVPELKEDRWVAVPMRARATDAKGYVNDFSIQDLVTKPGFEPKVDMDQRYTQLPSRHRYSEGWAWIHNGATLGIFSFNQKNMLFSVVSAEKRSDGAALRFGGACMISGEPDVLTRIAPGETVDLGVIRYQSVKGDYREAAYAYRAMLDEKGCRFPNDYNPPVHWEQLYDMRKAWLDRPRLYTKAILEKEAAKAQAYSCEALYLDPGWDTDFGSFLWGEKWLGPRKEFIQEMQSKYGLKVSLHCPLATWISDQKRTWSQTAVKAWPEAAARLAPGGTYGPLLCLGSRQYQDEAEKRLNSNCADGVVFLMFDGNWWNGGCLDTNHGHPVPYLIEDHIRANLDLVQRVHKKHPKVLIEMHDPIVGGSRVRVTPVYYKNGLLGSYDENWGFELMWNSLAALREGSARSLYYYNLGCNVPLYLHINLSNNNTNCVVLWWYASTCRHLGIGGTSPDLKVVEAQKKAMQRYRELDRFFKRGEFYGINEEIHLHVLPKENAFVVNVFNLSDQPRKIGGNIALDTMGLNPKKQYHSSANWGTIEGDQFKVSINLPAWSAEVAEIKGQ